MSSEPLILNLAPTGMVPTRAMTPNAPLQPDEVVKDVLSAAETGITIVHVHARDENDEPTHCNEVSARIIGGIRENRADLVVCASCSGRRGISLEQRSEVLDLEGDLKPDMASLTLSSLNFASQASVNAPETVKGLAQRMLERGIRPEVEIFDLGMVNMLRYLLKHGPGAAAGVRQPPIRQPRDRASRLPGDRGGGQPASGRCHLGPGRHRVLPAAGRRNGGRRGSGCEDRAGGQPMDGPRAHPGSPPTPTW
jgi:3-keto-5-aminohexanoate cleavage enzyme